MTPLQQTMKLISYVLHKRYIAYTHISSEQLMLTIICFNQSPRHENLTDILNWLHLILGRGYNVG